MVGSTEKRRRDPETTASLQLIKGSFGARGEEGTPAAVLRARLEATRAKVIAAAGLVCDAAEEEARAQFKAMRPKLDHCDGPALEALKALKAERASPPLDLKTAFLAPYGLSEASSCYRLPHRPHMLRGFSRSRLYDCCALIFLFSLALVFARSRSSTSASSTMTT